MTGTTSGQAAPGASAAAHLAEDDRSKDAFFASIAEVAEAMIDRHGKDFAMGVLILAARFIAEGKPLVKQHAA